MALSREIKIFTKNTLIVTLFFALVLELSWDYVAPLLWLQTNANNDTQFQQVDVKYMGNTATALSLAVGLQEKNSNQLNGWLSSDVITIAEALAHPADSQRRLIGGYMQSIQVYVNVLQTDIPGMLNQSSNRVTTLDEHIALLKSYGNEANDRIAILDDQIADLKATITQDTTETATAKDTLQSSLSSLDYNGVDPAIDTYVTTKTADTRARIYLIYLERFRDSYTKLQARNKVILTALVENRANLIQKNIVVIPSSGSDIIKELGLIQSEAEYKAAQSLN